MHLTSEKSARVVGETLTKIRYADGVSDGNRELLKSLRTQVAETVAKVDSFGSSVGIDMKLGTLESIVLNVGGGTFYRPRQVSLSLEDATKFGDHPMIHELAHHVQSENHVAGKLDYVFHMAYMEAASALFTFAYYEREESPEKRLESGRVNLSEWFAASVANGLERQYVLAYGLGFAACLIRPDINNLATLFMTKQKKETMDILAADFKRLIDGETPQGAGLKEQMTLLRKEAEGKGPVRWTLAAWLADADLFIKGPPGDKLRELGRSMGLEEEIRMIGFDTRGALFVEFLG